MSEFRFVSVGLAGENKPLNSQELNVIPYEDSTATDGSNVTVNPQILSYEGEDHNGEQYSSSVMNDNVITAKWLPASSNRFSPPDIRRGELVELWQWSDSDQYYWRDMGIKRDLRRLETVIYVFNGNPSNGIDSQNFDNCYFLEISTHTKKVTFSTSAKNNEVTRYVVQFDMENGSFNLEDDRNNQVFLDSLQNHIKLVNGAESLFELNQKSAHIKVLEDIFFEASRDITIKADKDIAVNAEGALSLKSGNDTTITSGSNITAKAAREWLMSADGQAQIKASVLSVLNNMNVDGTITSTGDQMAGMISQIRHTHGGVRGGDSNTNAPNP